MTTLIPIEVLEKLRGIGDPAAANGEGVHIRLERGFNLADGAALASLAVPHLPDRGDVVPDPRKLMLAQRLFARYGSEIAGALLLAALPQSYASLWGAKVLEATAALNNDFRRRILLTAQFLLLVTRAARTEEEVRRFWPANDEEIGDLDNGLAPPWKVCVALRAIHQHIRAKVRAEAGREVGPENMPPLNQEDLLAMLLTFSVSVFEVLERYGIRWSTVEQDAYLHLWDVIGSFLGIGTPDVLRRLGWRGRPRSWQGLRPTSVPDTRRLLAQLRRRLWRNEEDESPLAGNAGLGTPVGDQWRQTQAGQILVRALLIELAAAMPGRLRGEPITVIRSLAPPVVRANLLLGGGGVLVSLADALRPASLVLDDYAAPPYANPADARLLRLMANDVTRRATVHFLRTSATPFVLPDLEDWGAGLLGPDVVSVGNGHQAVVR